MDAATLPACCICHRDLRDDELEQYACRICACRIDENLASLAGQTGLYARLSGHMTPGAGGGEPIVSGTRAPGIPLRLEVLNLSAKGGLVTLLQTWVADWASYGHATLDSRGSLQRQVDEAVRTLRFNLDWAIRSHAALDDFADEIWQARRACEAIVSTEPAPREIKAPCPCGNVIRYTLDTEERRCLRCRITYVRGQLIELTRGERAAA